jgi:hypothetical protein
MIKINIYLYLFFAFFPFLCFYKIGTDTQPYFLIFGSILFLFTVKNILKMTKEVYYLFILLFISLLLFFISSDLHNWIRGVAGYYNLAIGTCVLYYILNNYYKIFEKSLVYSLIIWLLIALVQIFYDRSFGIEFLNRMILWHNRGVSSLSPEPTTFAIILLFYLFIIKESFLKYKKYIAIALFLIILLFTQSSLFIMLSFIYVGYYSLIYLSWKRIFVIIFLIIIIVYFIYFNFGQYNSQYRFLELLVYFIENPIDFLQDGSINDRIASIYFPILGFIKSVGIPHGFGNYSDFLTFELPKYDFFGIWVSIGNRIMSFYASSLFELGIFGLVLISAINSIIYSRFKNDTKNMLLNLLFMNTLLLMAIPLSNPLVSMYLAILIYRRDNENITSTQ